MKARRRWMNRRWVIPAAVLVTTLSWWSAGCDSVSSPINIVGVNVDNTEPPTLTIISPDENISISRGASFVIEWLDTDRDSNALISFDLVSVDDPNMVIPLVNGIQENGDGANDRFTINTQLLPLGEFNLRGRIDDGDNRPTTALAFNAASGLGEVVIRIVPPGGSAITNLPPQVYVREPAFNLSVSQDDVVRIVVQPTFRDPNADPALGPIIDNPYDVDSTSSLFVVLDLDSDPRNDDVFAPDASKIIALIGPEEIERGDPGQRIFPITVDLSQIPLRSDGAPYRIRASIIDGQNPPVHAYAAGTLNVVRAASGSFVDLGTIGRTTAGVRFVGFNPGSNLGTRMVNIRDFDLDGIDDFCLVARWGNPRNFGNIGEAYVIYGLPGQRFGGAINVNSVAQAIPGFVVEAPPPRRTLEGFLCGGGLVRVDTPRTEGLTDVSFIPDLNGDNRPELLFGTPHCEGYLTTRDDDPGDNAPDDDQTLNVELSLVHGQNESELTVEAEPNDVMINFTYNGTSDVVISSAQPNTNLRSADLEWINAGPNNRKYSLIKFANILDQFPPEDSPETIGEISGQLEMRILEAGGQATIHELFRDFDENTVTFGNFGEPEAGIDYDEDEITSITADSPGGMVTVELDELLTRLLFGQLAVSNNEIRLIIVPTLEGIGDDAEDAARLGSKEFGDPRQRPTVTIEYDRVLLGGPLGCYPDPLPNNFSDIGTDDAGCNERKLDAGGFVSLLASTNRDAAAAANPDRPTIGGIDPDRLTNTTISLELVGMRPTRPLQFGINADEQAVGDEPNRVEGCRFTAGWYDYFDHLQLNQPPLNGMFGTTVSWIPDVDLDNVPEVVISSPTNEADHILTLSIPNSTHAVARAHVGSITVIPGSDFDVDTFRDKPGAAGGTTQIPWPGDESSSIDCADPGDCGAPGTPRCGRFIESGTWEVFAEDPNDRLGGAKSAGDFNLDSIPDLMCGAPLNDRSPVLPDTGALYILFLRPPIGSFFLSLADDPLTRPPMLRVRGETPGDQIGWRQEPVTDVNGDGIDDVMFSSPFADFIVPPPDCLDPTFDGALDLTLFNSCRALREVFLDDVCKNFDYNNDRVVDDADGDVLSCLIAGDPNCCPVDNGYVGIIFGGVTRQGDRVISQVGTNDLGGVIFYGSNPGDRAGFDISSAGDFDKDGFGDFLISAPGEIRVDPNGRTRMGVTYLVYGGPHLETQEVPVELSEIGDRIPGMVFLSPFIAGAPDEAPTDSVGFLGDINGDGFGDIAIGVTKADLLDEDFPQGGGSENETGRRPDQGDVYVIYGNNIGR